MKRLLFMMLSFSILSAQDGKFAVSILDFTGEDVKPKVLRACYQQLETSLIESNRFTVIEKGQRDELLEEQKFQSSGMCDDACAVEIGQLVGAEYLMLGEIIGFADLYQVNIKIINIEKGDVAEKVTDQITGGMGELLNGMEQASQEIVRRIASGSATQMVNQQQGQQATIQKTYGSIDVSTDPNGADILIDLVEYGVTPKLIPELETGPHNLILNYPGYERLQKRIMVEEGKTIPISEYLVPKTGSLSVLSEPIGAMVYLDNFSRGLTPLDLKGLPVKDYIIRLELKDYQTIERRVTVQYAENTTQKYTLEPLPGKLSLFTSPPSSNIYISGKKYKSGSNGIFSIDLPVGRYTIQINKEGYEPIEKTVSVKPNDLGTLDINLKKLPAGVSSNPDMGFLTVNSLDGKVRLKIEGVKEIQRLPFEYYELIYGTYNLKAFGIGLETEKRKVDVERQKTTTIDINLKKKQRSKAIKYSLMFPGGGQFYEGSVGKFRGAFYAATFIGTGFLLNNSISNLSSENKLMDQYQSDYIAASSAADIDATWALYEKQSTMVNDAQTNLMIISTTFISAYISSIIDSYFFSSLK